MSIALRDALARLTVPELKDLVSHLPSAETAGRKDELIERIVAGIETENPVFTRQRDP